jgi:hypothetical protein
VHWLYTQQLPTHYDDWFQMGIVKEAKETHGDERLYTCLKAYALGERFDIPAFSCAANNLFANNIPLYYPVHQSGLSLACYAFQNIRSDRVILQNLVDKYCVSYDFDGSGYSLEGMGDLPIKFLRRTIHRFQELSEMSAREKRERRCYLEHDLDEEKKECGALHMWYVEEFDLAFFE